MAKDEAHTRNETWAWAYVTYERREPNGWIFLMWYRRSRPGVRQTFLELSPSPTSPIIHLMITAEMSSKKKKRKRKEREKKEDICCKTQSKERGMQAAWSTFLVASDDKKTCFILRPAQDCGIRFTGVKPDPRKFADSDFCMAAEPKIARSRL